MFDNTIKFKYSWRPYQEQVLKDVTKHIRDKKIHIVAAPGSGKTVLGLELARYIGKSVLILSPTLTIKNQWIDRFVSLFMPEGSNIPDWINTDIYDLKYFNSVTYQALHYAYKKVKQRNIKNEDTDDEELIKEEVNENVDIKQYDLIEEIKKQKIETIVLDEAHHLKSEWWKSLTKVIESLPNITLISLTATPPYDVEYNEWQKYSQLCGPIDAEISVPELIKVDNLCPHQDYVYFNYPTQEERKHILDFKKDIKTFIEELKTDSNFINAILNHEYIIRTELSEEKILSNPEYYSSMLIFLNEVEGKVDKDKVKILGHNKNIPKLTLEWLEILLQNCIYEDREAYVNYEKHIQSIEDKLNKIGAIEKRRVMLVNNKALQKYFVNSIGKLNSINEIVKMEYNNLKQDLRMVILTDYIRKEYLEDSNIEINKLGVFPIVINILKQYPDINLGILTGSLFAIPKEKQNDLIEECEKLDIDISRIKFEDLSINERYTIVKTADKYRNSLMKAIAKLFSTGKINIIVGTKSLLGEGWDEPSINSLILASFVGSYMLSNQMRGRAIRTNDNPRKTANVWHLVSILDFKDDIIKNPDYEMLKRRFKCFVGIGDKRNIIENGIDRLDIIPQEFSEKNLEIYKQDLQTLSNNRDEMYDKWKRLTANYQNKIRVVENIEMPQKEITGKFSAIDFGYLIKTFIFFLIMSFIKDTFEGFAGLAEADMDIASHLGYSLLIGFISMFTFIIVSFRSIVICIKALTIGVPKRLIKQIAKITLISLCRFGFIKTDYEDMKIMVPENKDNEGKVECYLCGATPHENNIFVSSMIEIFSKVEEQRYIIVKGSKKIEKLQMYYSVPSLLAQNKEMATYFFDLWNTKIEKSRLIYTKTADGRKILLNARVNSFEYSEKAFSKQKVISDWK